MSNSISFSSKVFLGIGAALVLAWAGNAAAQTVPTLKVGVDTAPSVPAGLQDATIANIVFDTTGSSDSVRINALPVGITFGSSALASNLTDCRVRNTQNLSGALNTSVPVTVSGTNTFTLDSALTFPVGTRTELALTCDVASSTAVGGTIVVSVAPASVAATAASNGAAVTPTVGTLLNGATAETSGTVTVTSGTGVGGDPTTPGLPDTGFGGNSIPNILMLLSSLTLGLIGVFALRRALA